MAKIAEYIKHPLKHAGNARWKAGHFYRAVQHTFLQAPQWVRACNKRLEVVDYGEHFRKFRREMHTAAVEQRPLCGTCERIWAQPHPLDYELRLSLLRYRMRF